MRIVRALRNKFQSLAPVLLLLFSSVSTPSQAQELQAEQVCAAIPDKLSASDIATLKEQIVLFAPVKYHELAMRLVIVNVADADQPAPYVDLDSAGPPTIFIPEKFRALQCRLTIATMLYSVMRRAPDEDSWRNFSIPRYVAECEPRRNGMIECLNRLSKVLMPPAEGGMTETLMSMFETASNDAFLHVILHEFAHLAFANKGNAYQNEYEADIYAGLRMALSRRSANGALYSYGGLSASDPYSRGPHGAFACRAGILQSVQRALAPLVSASFGWTDGDKDEYLKLRRRPPPDTSMLAILGGPAECPSTHLVLVEAVRKDIQGLVDLLDKDVAQTGSTLPEQITMILDAKPQTEEGRMFRMSIVSTRIWSASVDNDSLDALRIQLPLVQQVLKSKDISYLRSDDYGRLLAMRAIMTYEISPAGSSMIDIDAVLRRELETAVRFHPRYSIAQMHLGLIAYRQGRCTEGRTYLLNAAEISGDSMDTARLVQSILLRENQNGCAKLSAEMMADWRRLKNWR